MTKERNTSPNTNLERNDDLQPVKERPGLYSYTGERNSDSTCVVIAAKADRVIEDRNDPIEDLCDVCGKESGCICEWQWSGWDLA